MAASMTAPFDLMKPRFTQAQVLRMLPMLKPKTLQNWSSRGITDPDQPKLGKGERRLYSPIGIIMLDFMAFVILYGVPPKEARDMADYIAERAIERFENDPFEIMDDFEGSRWIPVKPETIDGFKRAEIVTFDGSEYFLKYRDDPNDFDERIEASVAIKVEIDFRIAQALNRVFLVEAGQL